MAGEYIMGRGGLAIAFGEVPEAVLKHVLSFSFRAQGCSTRCGGSFGKRNTSGMFHRK